MLAAGGKPLIAAVHGWVVGGGFEMALLADFCWAADDARFRLPEVGLGMIPGVGGTQTAPRAVGRGRAADLILARRWLDAGDALALGVVTRVVPGECLAAEADTVARAVAALDPLVVRWTRAAVQRGLDQPLADALRLEDRLARICRRRAAAAITGSLA
jgi:enoyl-CoA hydratase